MSLIHFFSFYPTTILAFVFVAVGFAKETQAQHAIEAKGKYEKAWKTHATRTLSDLPSIQKDTKLDEFGGDASGHLQGKATGFFHTEKIDGRWWLVDPLGNLFISKGMNSVKLGRTSNTKKALKQKFENESGWAKGTTSLLREYGFNCIGAWSENELFRAVEQPMPQTKLWSFMSTYGKKRGGTHMEAGHTGYTNDAIFVFDPEFETFCNEYAQQLADSKDDPWLIGHFSDNELPLKRSIIEGFLTLPKGEAGYVAAWDWLRKRHGADATIEKVTDQDRIDFLTYVSKRYFEIVSAAIRKHDPNHLFLGARFHSAVYNNPELFEACGPFVDVVSVNYYFEWTPDPTKLAMWAAKSGKPLLITEWYAKGEDSGMGNTGGAGWLVHSQQDRAAFYQHFALSLLESKDCVGWHWFRYADNDPDDKTVDPSNRDSNKGVVNAVFEPWQPLLDGMSLLNDRTYSLIHHFDREQKR